jgi:lipid-A-disaccharide synthase
MPETVMIVTGETSGELYGSLLAVSLRKRVPGIRILGIGGEKMREAGVELVSGITSAFGIAEAVSSLRQISNTLASASRALIKERPGVLVLIDYPDFNLKLAALAKKEKIKVLYYVSPQVWAWRRNRIKKIARLVDKMAVILPFEEEIYRVAGVECEFVGHPVFDEIQGMRTDKDVLKDELGLQRKQPLLALLPGSRPHELERLLPLTLDVVRRFRKEFEPFQFCVPLAPNTDPAAYSKVIDDLRREGVVINKGESLKVLAAADMAVVASGTATLQAVLLGIPFVVIYKLFPLTYWLGKMILKVKHISLVNILSGGEIVKELLQADATPENIIYELRRITADSAYREKMIETFSAVTKMFSGRNASEKVADMAIRMAGWK